MPHGRDSSICLMPSPYACPVPTPRSTLIRSVPSGLVKVTTNAPVFSSTGAVLRSKFPFLTTTGTTLLTSLLSLDPTKRPSTVEILAHHYFKEDPKPKAKEMFPTFPSRAGQEKRRRISSPNAPKRGDVGRIDFGKMVAGSGGIFGGRDEEEIGGGFSLRLI